MIKLMSRLNIRDSVNIRMVLTTCITNILRDILDIIVMTCSKDSLIHLLNKGPYLVIELARINRFVVTLCIIMLRQNIRLVKRRLVTRKKSTIKRANTWLSRLKMHQKKISLHHKRTPFQFQRKQHPLLGSTSMVGMISCQKIV